MKQDPKVKEILKGFSPEERGFAEAVTMDRVELGALRSAFASLKKDHEGLWNLLIVVLMTLPDRKLTVHKSQFTKFRESYRILQYWDEKGDYLTYELKTVTDNLEPSGEDELKSEP